MGHGARRRLLGLAVVAIAVAVGATLASVAGARGVEVAPTREDVARAIDRLGYEASDLQGARAFRMPGSSMEPTLRCTATPGCSAPTADRVISLPYGSTSPRRRDLVVFRTPPLAAERCGAGGTFLKRIVGLPGETVEMRLIGTAGYVFIDGRRLEEPYIAADRRQTVEAYGPSTVPRGHYFVMGDNREASCDSREWGTVPRKNIIGQLVAIYWPPARLRRL